VRLGVSLVDPGASFDEVTSVAELADGLGFETMWTNESVAREALGTLAAWAGRSEHAVLATGVSPVYLRPPFFAAMAAATLAEIAGPGRFWFGVGSGSSWIASRWLEREIRSPLAAVREYVTIVRRLLSGEEVTFSGHEYRIDGARLALPPSEPVPVLVAALGPKMIGVACEAADGILLNWNSVAGLRVARKAIGEAVGGRDFITAAYVRVATHPDSEAARRALRADFAGYLRFPQYRSQLAALGWEGVASEVGRAWKRRDREAAAAAVPEEVALQFGVAGDEATCRQMLTAYADCDIEHVVVRPVPVEGGGLEPAVRAAAELL
jgi:alkanesulfonate monooxygenase SsuD/methylene tetrahydromethanopterin reductase-like flavin-dependent oxidoreductase (luciferase family)